MWNEVGIIRDEQHLRHALEEIKRLRGEAEHLWASDTHELQSCLEIRDMLKVAEVIILSALERKESRGAHFRSDYPQMDAQWEKNIKVYEGPDGGYVTEIVPVVK
jgi:succinate dehydrogenase/fumarate reductase flavoprotein subunit